MEKSPTPRERIALCLIAYNEPRHLDRCLSAFAPAVSEMVVVHATGATPRDPALKEICDKHGARYAVYENTNAQALAEAWPHVDNFAKARQMSFDLATREWCLWADIDDIPGPDFAKALHELLEKHGGEGYAAFCLPHNVAGRGIANNMRERLVRRTAGHWQGAIHENWVPLDMKGAKIAKCNAPSVVHIPLAGEKEEGSMRNLRILESLPEHERDASTLCQLTGEYMGHGRKNEAMKLSVELLKRDDVRPTDRYELCLNICEMLRPPVIDTSTDTYRKMTTALLEAYKTQPWRREALAHLGAMHLDLGDLARAEGYLRAMMSLPVPAELPWTHRHDLYGWAGETLWTQFLRAAGRRDQADAIEKARMARHRYGITIVHPTRGRAQEASHVRKSWLTRAANGERIEHIFGLEADSPDVEILGRFRCGFAPAGKLDSPGGNAVAAYNAAARAASPTSAIIICAQDDMPAPPLHWDVLIEDALRPAIDAGKPAVLRIRDGYRKDDLLVTPCMTRAALSALGYSGGVYSDAYTSMFCDTELSVRAAEKGWLVDSDIVIPHEHPANTNAPLHETTARSNRIENYREGYRIFCNRNPRYVRDNPGFAKEFEHLLKDTTP